MPVDCRPNRPASAEGKNRIGFMSSDEKDTLIFMDLTLTKK